jgi:hypothetical protein
MFSWNSWILLKFNDTYDTLGYLGMIEMTGVQLATVLRFSWN